MSSGGGLGDGAPREGEADNDKKEYPGVVPQSWARRVQTCSVAQWKGMEPQYQPGALLGGPD